MKRPAFQFYPADWRKHSALQLCSISARGLWWEMICLMHEANPYGHLVAGGQNITVAQLARLVGESTKDVTKWLEELRRGEIFSVTDAGIIYSRRMVRDQVARDEWVKRQHKHRDKDRDNGRDVTPPVTPPSRLSASAPAFASSSASKTEPLVVVPTVASQPANADPPAKVNGTVSKNLKVKTENWKDPLWLKATAETLGLTRHPQQSDDEWQDRVISTLNARRSEGAVRR